MEQKKTKADHVTSVTWINERPKLGQRRTAGTESSSVCRNTFDLATLIHSLGLGTRFVSSKRPQGMLMPEHGWER